MVDEERDSEGREEQDAPSTSNDGDAAERSNENNNDEKDADRDSDAGDSAPDQTDGDSGGPEPPASKGDGSKKPAAWGDPIHRFSEAWVRFEIKLCAGVLIAEILALCAWVLLKGLAVPPGSDSSAGVIVRAAVGATVFGLGAYFAARKKNASFVRFATGAAILIGLVVAKAWDGVGSVYFSNLLNWMQDASALTLIDGLRGFGTRLTVWLAMLGGSLAAASGKHIHIDVVRRFLPEKLRMPATMVAWVGAAAVCFAAAWGFTDHISIGSYHVDRNAPASEKLSALGHHASLGFFVLRKQARLDLGTLPVVLAGRPYDSWLTNKEWNEKVTDAGWEDYFTPEQAAGLRMPDEIANDPRMPLVIVPGAQAGGMLKHLLNLVFPLGFIMIGLRFLLRSVLVLSGHVKDEAEGEVLPPKGDADAATEKGAEG
jgi:TRAP-type C4-dicarboxylate transport system permease small subunit